MGGVLCLTFGRCGGEYLFTRIQKGEERIQATRKKAMRIVYKQDPEAGISGNDVNRSSLVEVKRERDQNAKCSLGQQDFERVKRDD